MTTAGVLYRYVAPSSLTDADGPLLGLSTWTPTATEAPCHPLFFVGFIAQPEIAAAGILAVARVAGSRYYEEPSTVAARLRAADPVVTCDGERLRFESFSMCAGVHARLDLDPPGLESEVASAGTTNVDVNPPLRDALSRVGPREPLRVRVGPDQLTVDTLTASVVEKKVVLPTRWLKSFGETQLAETRMGVRMALSNAGARRLLQSLPTRSARDVLWAHPSDRAARWSARPAKGAVCLVGTHRVAALIPMLQFARRLTVYGPDVDSESGPVPSAWEFELPAARFTLVLSPEPRRGFSGEGGLLSPLLSDEAFDAAARIERLINRRPLSTADALAAEATIGMDLARDGLDVLAAAGRIGFDLSQGAFFSRVLPFDPTVVADLHPRVASTQALLDAGAVSFDPRLRRAVVVSGDHHHVVDLPNDSGVGATCTCPWFAKHRDERGLCRHVLATIRFRAAERH